MRLKFTLHPLLDNVGRFIGVIPDPDIRRKYLTASPRRRRPIARKYRLFVVTLFSSLFAFAQMSYDNFEGTKYVYYHDKSGVLDSAVANPAPNSINNSPHCALYIRNKSKKFDNIKMKLVSPLANVTSYATYAGEPPRLKMKVYTTAPAGTLVEILLGSHGRNSEYPAGTNSQYQAYTSKTNQWEELTFLFSQVPQGSQTSFSEVDQITLLFNPNSSTSDKYYFDEITGPALVDNTQQAGMDAKKSESHHNKKKEKK